MFLFYPNRNKTLERVRGIEPLSLPWEGNVEPLNYTRNEIILSQSIDFDSTVCI